MGTLLAVIVDALNDDHGQVAISPSAHFTVHVLGVPYNHIAQEIVRTKSSWAKVVGPLTDPWLQRLSTGLSCRSPNAWS